jgi:hypothetical protein
LAANNSSSNKPATNAPTTSAVRDNTVSGEPQAGGIIANQEKDRGEKSSPAPMAVTLHRQVSYFLPQTSKRSGEERTAVVSQVVDAAAGVVGLHVSVLPGDFGIEMNVRFAPNVKPAAVGERTPNTWAWPARRG